MLCAAYIDHFTKSINLLAIETETRCT